jgi:hypothetical protein
VAKFACVKSSSIAIINGVTRVKNALSVNQSKAGYIRHGSFLSFSISNTAMGEGNRLYIPRNNAS